MQNELREIDQALRRELLRFDLSRVVTPTNREEARQAFLSPRRGCGRRDPVFEYDRNTLADRGDLPRLPLDGVNAPEGILELYGRKEEELAALAGLLESRGTETFPRWSVDLFGAPAAEQAALAEARLESLADISPPEKTRNARELADRLEARLARFSLDFAVELDPDMFTKIMVNAAAKRIRLKGGMLFSVEEIDRLVVHEVDVHALRILNGTKSGLGIFALGTAGYREAEEGTAVYFEQKTGHLYPWQEKMYAGRCLAVHLGLSTGFGDVFDALLPYFDVETAYYLAERTKRGLGDTSLPGALTKEFHYFTGPTKVESYVEGGGDLGLLWSGKIGFDDLPIVETLIAEGMMEPSSWTIPWERER